jgi:3-hydroxybutyryl-CoA dehydrogenase
VEVNTAIKKVCVVGAGTMGNGIAQASAQAGYKTAMVDIRQEFLDRGMNSIRAGLAKFVHKGKLKQEEVGKILARIRVSTKIEEAAGDSDYVIESVFERTDIKSRVFQQLEEICGAHTILASNTSGIPISLLASATKRPDKVIGMHFMYPVPIMGVVEVVRSLLTSDETLASSLDFAKSMGKQPIVVKDSPGFVSNRIIPLILNEAAKILEENLATVADTDKLFRLTLDWPIGPFGLLDVIGIDTLVDLLEGIYDQASTNS